MLAFVKRQCIRIGRTNAFSVIVVVYIINTLVFRILNQCFVSRVLALSILHLSTVKLWLLSIADYVGLALYHNYFPQ